MKNNYSAEFVVKIKAESKNPKNKNKSVINEPEAKNFNYKQINKERIFRKQKLGQDKIKIKN